MTTKAMCAGINSYAGSPLRGCLDDVETWFNRFTNLGKIKPDSVRAVCDARATTQGIRDRQSWLREGMVGKGDTVLFQYSGHGSHVRDRGVQDEVVDHEDECLVPFDMDWDRRIITDDDLGDWIRTFPTGVRVVLILDCCHSGSGTRELANPMENPHYKADRFLAPPLDIALRSRPTGDRLKLSRVKVGMGLGSRQKGKKTKLSRGILPNQGMNHLLLAACRSDQTAADAQIGGKFCGAFTHFLTRELDAEPKAPVSVLMERTTQALKRAGYSQEPMCEGPAEMLAQPLFL